MPKSRTADKLDEKIRARNMRIILDVATDVFSRKGFDGTRIAEIAELAGLPKANIYYYFASKEEVYSAIIANLIAGWDDALSSLRADREPAEALRDYVKVKLEYTRNYPRESRLFASEIIQGARFLSEKDRAHMRLATDRHAAILEQWMSEGRMAIINPRHFFIILWAATQFYSDFEPLACDALNTGKLTPADFNIAADTIVRTVLAGVMPPNRHTG
ncbi:TetR family transcriptional regulator C-terminal domain-containing protein [Rhizobium sullae]|uniref:TetR family transcriptional regulator n=1 Tax=Rhizobium sullae TaxID=50338 RepID=A0A2N0D759_RHISU|nr:TetR family transcriptional regulator C-terminal domain-containing protein [Rhizobium sullae]PKA41929.1 TetR family transcriptional regulator [Rhizobium sullae]UWU13608.1 TetR family transcriptional regulator C-terminal domain-containing protein [Rhizobium sullae]